MYVVAENRKGHAINLRMTRFVYGLFKVQAAGVAIKKNVEDATEDRGCLTPVNLNAHEACNNGESILNKSA